MQSLIIIKLKIAAKIIPRFSHRLIVPYINFLSMAWLGHSSSEMLDLHYHLHDEDSQQAMLALANTGKTHADLARLHSTLEGNLRAKGQSKIEKTLQVAEVKELVTTLSNLTERGGFEPPVRVYPVRRFSKPLP